MAMQKFLDSDGEGKRFLFRVWSDLQYSGFWCFVLTRRRDKTLGREAKKRKMQVAKGSSL